MADTPDMTPTPAELEQQLVTMFVHEVFNTLSQFSLVDTETAAKQATISARQQLEVIKTILPTLHPANPQCTTHPTIAVHIRHVESKMEGVLTARKLMAGLKDPAMALSTAMVFALLGSPQARALLAVNGFQIRFVQTTQVLDEPKKSLIVT